VWPVLLGEIQAQMAQRPVDTKNCGAWYLRLVVKNGIPHS
jgi:hypothetical protein